MYWRTNEMAVKTRPMPKAFAAVMDEKPNMGKNTMFADQLIAKPMAMFAQASVNEPNFV